MSSYSSQSPGALESPPCSTAVGPGQLCFNQPPWDPFTLLDLLKFCDDFNSSVENHVFI